MGSFYDWSKDQYLSGPEPDRAVWEPRPQPERPAPVRVPARAPSRAPSRVPARTPRRAAPASARKRASRRRQQLRRRNWGIAAAVLFVLILLIWKPWHSKSAASAPPAEDSQKRPVPMESTEVPVEDPGVPLIDAPDWVTVDMLSVNEYSRPGTLLTQVNGVVVHYVGNPGTTAKQNRNYYASLAETHETWASSHFVIDTDGTVIQCVPLNEVAYCSNNRNSDTISIECCHLDEDGEFTQETMESLTRLLNWLIGTYGLEREDILRHYDITGKECPRYFVQNPDQWERFLNSLTYPS